MPSWIQIILALNFGATVSLFVWMLLRRGPSIGQVSSLDQKADSLRLLILEGTTQTSQLSTKHDQFVTSAAQSTSNLRTELLASISSESSQLRQEVVSAITQIGNQTRSTLEDLRSSTTTRLDKLTTDLASEQSSLREALNARLNTFQTETTAGFNGFRDSQLQLGENSRLAIEGTLSRLGRDIRDAVGELKADLNNRINELIQQTESFRTGAETQQNALRETVEQRLEKLSELNSKKLDEMRETVDEKLHRTLETRLTETFGVVTDHLGKVQSGLGEMKELASGVGDLKRLLTNVRTRGNIAEFAVSMQLEQMLAPNQFIKNASIKPGSKECVEFAIRIPNGEGTEALLPIDSKFPKEDWERLEDAIERDDSDGVKAFRKALLSRIRAEAKKICDLYIYPPITTDLAIMCLGTEGLYAEANREPGFVDSLRSEFRIIVAGPTTLMAILSSLQMGFKTLAIQKKGSEVWNLLAATKNEFGKFGILMNKVEKQVGTVQNTLHEVGVRTKAINKTLLAVEVLEMGPSEGHAVLDLPTESSDEDLIEVADDNG